jgi:ribose transport system substrate-binding protein
MPSGRTQSRGAIGVVALLLALASTGCRDTPTSTVALVQINQEVQFFSQMNDGAREAARAAGAELLIYNSENNALAQSNAIETYVARKVDALIVVAIDVDGIMPAVEQAAAAGIPVLAVDAILPTGPQRCQIGVDNERAGQQLGEMFAGYVDDHMTGQVEIGIIGASSTSQIQLLRQRGFEQAIARNPRIKVVQVVDGHNRRDSSLAAAENLLTANPHLKLIYATGEPALTGALGAVESQHREAEVKLFGWDLTPSIIEGIDGGIVVAVVQQDPTTMGRSAVETAMKLIRGRDVARRIELPVVIVTKGNVDRFRSISP